MKQEFFQRNLAELYNIIDSLNIITELKMSQDSNIIVLMTFVVSWLIELLCYVSQLNKQSNSFLKPR